jgi:hypothetical protein
MTATRTPYNSAVEYALRSTVILHAAFPAAIALQRLVYLDYLTVHSADFRKGSTSLHVDTPNRAGEVLVRRESIRCGIALAQSRRLIETVANNLGLRYRASETSTLFLDTLSSSYVTGLRGAAQNAVYFSAAMEDVELGEFFRTKMRGWGAEFEHTVLSRLEMS